MTKRQEPSPLLANPPAWPTPPPLTDTQLLEIPRSPSAIDFLKELETHYINHPAIRRRYPSPPEGKLHRLPRKDKSSTSIFQIGPDKDSASLSPSSLPVHESKTGQEEVEDIDDNCSIGTTASWIIDNLDFRTPSSSEMDEDEKREEDELFLRGDPDFIFPFPEGSSELPKYLTRGKSKKQDAKIEEAGEDNDRFTTISENVDQVALAAFATTVLFVGMWVLENGYTKALLFR